jgi:hypothetical protein
MNRNLRASFALALFHNTLMVTGIMLAVFLTTHTSY